MIPTGTPDGRSPIRQRRDPWTPADGYDLARMLDDLGLSTRELARRLEVSPMWVSRRTTGEVALTSDEAERIADVLREQPPF